MALALFALIAAASVDVSLLRRAVERNEEESSVYDDFLEAVRSSTRPGDSIALVAPAHEWGPYSYGLFRAMYVLSGREVLPIVGPDNQPLPANLQRAAYVAVWRPGAGDRQRPLLWRAHGGELLGPR